MADRNGFGSFSQARARLDEIVVEVRDKDLSLEKSLDLYEEAILLGNRCAELIDKSDYTQAEELAARETLESGAPGLSLSGQPGEEPDAAEAGAGAAQDAPADAEAGANPAAETDGGPGEGALDDAQDAQRPALDGPGQD